MTTPNTPANGGQILTWQERYAAQFTKSVPTILPEIRFAEAEIADLRAALAATPAGNRCEHGIWKGDHCYSCAAPAIPTVDRNAVRQPDVLKGYVLALQTVVELPDGGKELGYTLLDGFGIFTAAEEVHAAIDELSLPLGWVSMTTDQLLPGWMLPAAPAAQPSAQGPMDANELEKMATSYPDECFLKGSGVLKLIGAIRTLEQRLAAPAVAQPAAQVAMDSIRALLAAHAELMDQNEYCYFELARTRQTDWMAWITTKPREDDPQRKVLACGQGDTPDDACHSALFSLTTPVEQSTDKTAEGV